MELDVKYLNYVLMIANKRNMTKAAEELFISQSSLSQFLAKLEQEIGTPLFVRAKGELLLTPAGELYVEAARKVIEIRRNLYQNIRSLDNRGHITVGVTSQFGLRMLTEIIPEYKKRWPGITIEISESSVPQITKQIMEESMDCAIMALNHIEPFSREQVTLLRSEEVYFAIPGTHPYRSRNPYGVLSRKELTEEFADANFLLPKRASTLRELADEIFSAFQFQPVTMCETNSIIATRSMVASGIGVTFLAESCVTDRANVAYYSLKPRLSRYNALVWRRGWVRNEPENVFVDAVCHYFGDGEGK